MAIVIDRFEGDFAVVEIDGSKMEAIPQTKIPEGAKEGDVLQIVDGKYEIDIEETTRIKDEVKKRMEDMFAAKE